MQLREGVPPWREVCGGPSTEAGDGVGTVQGSTGVLPWRRERRGIPRWRGVGSFRCRGELADISMERERTPPVQSA